MLHHFKTRHSFICFLGGILLAFEISIMASAHGMPITTTIIDNNSFARYNDGLGIFLNTSGFNDPFPCNDVACGDLSARFHQAPSLSSASAALGNWLTNPSDPGGTWSSPQPIPNNWAPNTETAIIYKFELNNPVANTVLNIGVDNGVFVWLNGQYQFGARDGGPAIPGEYSINLGSLDAGNHYLQVIREDHGQGTDYDIRMIATNGLALTPGSNPYANTFEQAASSKQPGNFQTFTQPGSFASGVFVDGVDGFDKSKQTYVLVHGWNGHDSYLSTKDQEAVHPWVVEMANGLRDRSPDANIVAWNWTQSELDPCVKTKTHLI